MNIGDYGYSIQYHAKYERNPEEAIELIKKMIEKDGIIISGNMNYSIRKILKRVDILYNPESNMFCGLHEEPEEKTYES